MAMRVYLEHSVSGLWGAFLVTYAGEISLRGYLSRKMAEHAARSIALEVYGRTPYFIDRPL